MGIRGNELADKYSKQSRLLEIAREGRWRKMKYEGDWGRKLEELMKVEWEE